MWELSLLQACLEEEEDSMILHAYLQGIIQIKRVGKVQGWLRPSQGWIKLINSQRVEDVPRGIKWSHGMVSIVNYAFCTNPWSLWEFFVGLGCGVQVQMEHHKEIKCLKLAVLCGDNGLVKMCGRWLTHGGVWGSNQLVFIESTQSRKVVQLEGVKIVII